MNVASATRRGLARVALGLGLAAAALLGPGQPARAQFVMGGMGFGSGYPMMGTGFGYPLGGFGMGGYGGWGYGGWGYGGWGWGGPVMMGIPQPFNTGGWYTTGGFVGPGFGMMPNGAGAYGGWEGWNNQANLSLGITPIGIQSALMERGLAGTGLPAGGRLVPGTYRIEIVPEPRPNPTAQSPPPARANDQAPPAPDAPR